MKKYKIIWQKYIHYIPQWEDNWGLEKDNK